MKSTILLDTNAWSHLARGSERVLDLISHAERIYMSVIVVAELYAGFKGGSREEKNREILNRFLKKGSVRLLNVSLETAEIYADVFNQLKRGGNPIPMNDVWIAAQAIETGSRLLTYDRHFRNVIGLRIIE